MSRNYVTPSILPGFMELLPAEQMLFNKLLDTIRSSYELFGFIPLDTPTIEKSEILLAKSGGETEKQIYRFTKGDNDIALRFDLTVPLARYVAQHFNELTFPFRRYHIGKVFRGEKPQKGRFREFYQCDIDIVGNGSLSLINDAEILNVIYYTFKALGFDRFTVRINNRKILNGLFESMGIENSTEVLRAIDKLEKIGEKGVLDELEEAGIDRATGEKILEFIRIKGQPAQIVGELKNLGIKNGLFETGVAELAEVIEYIGHFGIPESNYAVDLTIARGLDYYTGTVYETILNDYPGIGSVCSGGRYDDLAGNYTKQNLPGVGISIGLTRLFYQLVQGGIIEKGKKATPTNLLLIPMADTLGHVLEISTKIRKAGIPTEVYFNEGKLGKKFAYADKLGIPYAVAIGEDEIRTGRYRLKNMITGEQKELGLEELIEEVRANT